LEVGHIAAPDSLDVLVWFARTFHADDYLGTPVVAVAIAAAVVGAGAAVAALQEEWPFVE
jgi:hypothetical protein